MADNSGFYDYTGLWRPHPLGAYDSSGLWIPIERFNNEGRIPLIGFPALPIPQPINAPGSPVMPVRPPGQAGVMDPNVTGPPPMMPVRPPEVPANVPSVPPVIPVEPQMLASGNGMILNNLGDLNLQAQIQAHGFAIRAEGKDTRSTPIYNIIRLIDSLVIGTLAVSENTETVEMRDSIGRNVLASTGGLFSHCEKMIIYWPNSPVMEIEGNDMNQILPGQQFYRLKKTPQLRGYDIFVLDNTGSRIKGIIGTITSRYDTAILSLHSPVDDRLVAMLLFATLKKYYTTYQFHMKTMPFGIVRNVRHATAVNLHPNLRFLRQYSRFVFRLTCHLDQNNWAMDVLNQLDGTLVLIVKISHENYEFVDLYNTTHFVVWSNPDYSTEVRLPPPSSLIIGSVREPLKIFNERNQPVLTMERTAANDPNAGPCTYPIDIHIKSIEEHPTTQGIIRIFDREPSAELQVNPNLHEYQKVMILTECARTISWFHPADHISPRVQRYPE